MITIKVEVFGGLLPVPIRIEIDKRNKPIIQPFEENRSFIKQLDLSKGVRTISFTLKNPIDGNTIITVSGVSANGNEFEMKKKIEGEDISTAIFKLTL
jgi:hypothetical protein